MSPRSLRMSHKIMVFRPKKRLSLEGQWAGRMEQEGGKNAKSSEMIQIRMACPKF
jgi:hypothetical protein